MTQQERIEAMRAEVSSLGGVVTAFEELPPHIEEDLLRRTLNKPGGYRLGEPCAACVEECAAGNEHELPHTCEG